MRTISIVSLALIGSSLAGCLKRDPLWCDETHPCADPTRPFCDLEAQFPESDNIRNTCIASPFDGTTVDANLPDAAPVCAANTTGCAANAYTECDAHGQYAVHFDCGVLGCDAAGDACLDIDPANGLAFDLDRTSSPTTPEDGQAWDFSGGLLTIDTDAGTAAYNGTSVNLPSRTAAQAAGFPVIRVFMVGSIKIKNLAASGANALAFVSNGDITITGAVDVSANNVTSPGGGGPGPGAFTIGNPCMGTSTDGTEGGGGGGRASKGLYGDDNTAGGAPLLSTGSGSPLVGGCAGGEARLSLCSPAAGTAGAGGGAIQITSRTAISVSGSAVMNASGGGGGAGGQCGGPPTFHVYSSGGGGSAGMILLEAPSVMISNGAVLAAKGGAGGGRNAAGADGSADASVAGAAGGVSASCTAPQGGDGVTLSWNETTHILSTSPDNGVGECGLSHGGGGGAAGYAIMRNNNSGIVSLNGAAVRASYPTNANISTRHRTKP